MKAPEVEYSVILARCQVESVDHIEGSLLGRDGVVGRSTGKPSATRLIAGDHSHIAI